MSKTNDNQIMLMRLAHPRAFFDFIDANGGEWFSLCHKAGLPLYADDPSHWVPLRSAWRLFDLAAKSWGPGIGWEVGNFVGDRKLADPLRLAIERSPTLYEGLQRLIKLIRSESSHLKLDLIEGTNCVRLATQYRFKDWPGYAGSQGYQLAVYINMVRHYTGYDWEPTEIGIEDSDIPPNLPALLPNTRIRCNQRMGYIEILRTDLHSPPIISADDGLPQTTEPQDFSFPQTVRAISNTYISEGYLSCRKMADILNISERTLHRKLNENNISYQRLIDQSRFKAAKDLLETSKMSVGDIAQAIGFSDPANFTRMFRRIGGTTPRQYRRSLLH